MAKVIHKFPLDIWAEVDPKVKPTERVSLARVPTGAQIDEFEGWTYFGTTQAVDPGGSIYVEHFYLDLRGLK